MKNKPPLLWISLAAAAAMAGCAAGAPAAAPAPAPAPVAALAPPAPQCSAEAAKFAVGQPHTAQLEIAARHRAGARTSRVLKPGQAVTMEFNGDRLNVDVDARNRVTSVRCG
jgi:hypothetical protein